MNAEPTIEQRAEKAYRVVLVYGVEDDVETAIRDLMADLLHLCEQYGDPEANQRMAWHNYVAERHEAAQAQS